MTDRFLPFERRSHSRFNVPGARVELAPASRPTNAPPPPKQAALVDLSVGGLSFACDGPIELGQHFRFDLYLPNHEVMRLLGRIKWRGRGPNTPGYVHGVEFARYGTAPGENHLEHEKALLALEASLIEHEVE